MLPNPAATKLYVRLLRLESPNLQTNVVADPRTIVIHNARDREKEFSLDINGFDFLRHDTTEKFLSKESIETCYYPDVQQLLKDHTGAQRVVILGHTIR